MKKGDHGELSSETMISTATMSEIQLGEIPLFSFEFAKKY